MEDSPQVNMSGLFLLFKELQFLWMKNTITSGVFLEKKSSREQTPAQSRGSNATEAGDGVEGGSPPSTARSLWKNND
jgi:hypothetical protein